MCSSFPTAILTPRNVSLFNTVTQASVTGPALHSWDNVKYLRTPEGIHLRKLIVAPLLKFGAVVVDLI